MCFLMFRQLWLAREEIQGNFAGIGRELARELEHRPLSLVLRSQSWSFLWHRQDSECVGDLPTGGISDRNRTSGNLCKLFANLIPFDDTLIVVEK